jgi:hypothetical protein
MQKGTKESEEFVESKGGQKGTESGDGGGDGTGGQTASDSTSVIRAINNNLSEILVVMIVAAVWCTHFYMLFVFLPAYMKVLQCAL